MRMEAVVAYFKVLCQHCLVGQIKTTINLSGSKFETGPSQTQNRHVRSPSVFLVTPPTFCTRLLSSSI